VRIRGVACVTNYLISLSPSLLSALSPHHTIPLLLLLLLLLLSGTIDRSASQSVSVLLALIIVTQLSPWSWSWTTAHALWPTPTLLPLLTQSSLLLDSLQTSRLPSLMMAVTVGSLFLLGSHLEHHSKWHCQREALECFQQIPLDESPVAKGERDQRMLEVSSIHFHSPLLSLWHWTRLYSSKSSSTE
jgi:energy-converting hydrogenase Eha subunit A